MIELPYAEVHWELNGHCKFQCDYCLPKHKSGELDRSIDEYLTIIDKLQQTRYLHHDKIFWAIGGGEPLHYPHLSTLLKKIKEKPSTIRLDTSGDNDWFSLYSVLEFVDSVKLTYHPWQSESVFEFILEKCNEMNKKVILFFPLGPGLINETREKIYNLKLQGYECNEIVLHEENGEIYRGYSEIDKNRIFYRDDNWVETPVILDPNLPDPRYVDLRIINDIDPIYTYKPCYAGVDWIFISAKGWLSYSQCGGRAEGLNVFNPNWQPPSNHFPCPLNQCRSQSDRNNIRIIGS